MRKLSWPTAAVLCTSILALGGSAVALVVTGADAETIAGIMGAESGLVAFALAVMRPLLGGQS